MNPRPHARAILIVAVSVSSGVSALALRQSGARDPKAVQGAATMIRASGAFDVKVNPQGPPEKVPGSTLARMSLDKAFHGDLEATSKGDMLTAVTDVTGSGAYVAIERVTGTLRGRTGTFVLQHSGTMTRGAQQLTITVVPDSGAGQLVGLAGRMTITIVDGRHLYEFEYTLGAS